MLTNSDIELIGASVSLYKGDNNIYAKDLMINFDVVFKGWKRHRIVITAE